MTNGPEEPLNDDDMMTSEATPTQEFGDGTDGGDADGTDGTDRADRSVCSV